MAARLKLGANLKMRFRETRVRQASMDVASKALIKQAAWVRRAAKSSIRKRAGESKPGNPPFSHSGLLRRHIYFDFDRHTKSAIIGPALLRGTRSRSQTMHGKTVPETLETGGVVRRWRGRRGHTSSGWYYRQNIEPRPYMLPALEKSRARMSDFWRQAYREHRG